MEYSVTIPKDILQALQQGTIVSRLQQQFGLSQEDALGYSFLYKKLQEKRPVVILADLHAPYHDQRAVETVIAYVKPLNPRYVIVLGDFADFYTVSSWLREPFPAFHLKEEIHIIRDLVKDITLELTTTETFLLVGGNHEDRMLRHLAKNCHQVSTGVPWIKRKTLPMGAECDGCTHVYGT